MALLATLIDAAASVAHELVGTSVSLDQLVLYGAITMLLVEGYRKYIAVDNKKK